MLHTDTELALALAIFTSHSSYIITELPQEKQNFPSHLLYICCFISAQVRTEGEQSTEHVCMRNAKGESKTRKHGHQPKNCPLCILF